MCRVDGRESAEASFSQGGKWKKLISRYIQAMPPIGRMPGPDAQIIACMSFAEIQAIKAKVGEAERASQPATSRNCRVSGGCFVASMDVVIFELPIELCRYFSTLNLIKIYDLTSGERE